MNEVILGMLVGVSRKLASTSPPKDHKIHIPEPPLPSRRKGMGRGPSLASKKLCCCVRALSPFTNYILGKKGSNTFKKGIGIKTCIGSSEVGHVSPTLNSELQRYRREWAWMRCYHANLLGPIS